MMKEIILEIFIEDQTPEFIELYQKHVVQHNITNSSSISNNAFPNAGFDLLIPENTVFSNDFQMKLVDLKIKAQMWVFDHEQQTYTPSAYYLYPRSSISKTPFMLANHVGIIDSGYRNNLMVALRKLPYPEADFATLQKHSRIVQICHPSLDPITVRILSSADELTTTSRKGGFGSTGATGVLGASQAAPSSEASAPATQS